MLLPRAMNADCAEPKEVGLITMGSHCIKAFSADKVFKHDCACSYFFWFTHAANPGTIIKSFHNF